jgi:hypothetical protein
MTQRGDGVVSTARVRLRLRTTTCRARLQRKAAMEGRSIEDGVMALPHQLKLGRFWEDRPTSEPCSAQSLRSTRRPSRTMVLVQVFLVRRTGTPQDAAREWHSRARMKWNASGEFAALLSAAIPAMPGSNSAMGISVGSVLPRVLETASGRAEPPRLCIRPLGKSRGSARGMNGWRTGSCRLVAAHRPGACAA